MPPQIGSAPVGTIPLGGVDPGGSIDEPFENTGRIYLRDAGAVQTGLTDVEIIQTGLNDSMILADD